MVSQLKSFVWFVVFALFFSMVAAQEFTAEFSPAQQTIQQNEIALYNVTITQAYPGIEFFEIYSPEVLWDIRTKDALHVTPNVPFVTTLMIQPLNINPGLYGVPIHVKRTGSNEVKKALLYMEVTGAPSTLTYLPAIRGTASLPAQVDPRNEVVITVNLENQNRRSLTKIDVKVRSAVINQDYETTLGPLERKTVRFTARIDPRTPPQQDTLKVSVIAQEKDKGFQFDLPPIDYEVMPYGQIVPVISESKGFLKTVKTITVTNDANILLKQPYAIPMGWFARIFTSTDPDARVEDGNLVWDITLGIGQSTEFRVTTNYRPLVIAVILLIIIIILYFVLRSPLVIKKSVTVVSTREGGISELKILLELRNRSGKPIQQTTVLDVVPRIAEIVREVEPGTLAPIKIIKHDKKGTILRYDVGTILPYEERMISYHIKSTLSILGGVSLPVAVSRFVTATGKQRTTSSNAPSIKF